MRMPPIIITKWKKIYMEDKMRKYLLKFLSITVFIVNLILFLPDCILYLSWKNEKDFYKLIPFLERKSYINPEDFLNSATEMILKWHYISYIMFFLILVISIFDVVKNKSKSNTIFNAILVILSFIIIIVVYKHYKIIDFYFNPVNDLPWDYRKV